MSGPQVLVLHGSPGSGKTTVARAVSERLSMANRANALIDLDELNIVYPFQPRSFSRSNLRAVWPNYAAIPDIAVILPLVVADHEDLAELRTITCAERFVVCELVAPRDVLQRRVRERESNEFLRERVLEYVDLHARRQDLESLRDFTVSTDGRSVDDTAAEVEAVAFPRT